MWTPTGHRSWLTGELLKSRKTGPKGGPATFAVGDRVRLSIKAYARQDEPKVLMGTVTHAPKTTRGSYFVELDEPHPIYGGKYERPHEDEMELTGEPAVDVIFYSDGHFEVDRTAARKPGPPVIVQVPERPKGKQAKKKPAPRPETEDDFPLSKLMRPKGERPDRKAAKAGFVIRGSHKKHSGSIYVCAVPAPDEPPTNYKGLPMETFENTVVETLEEAMLFPYPSAEVAAAVFAGFPPTKNVSYQVIEISDLEMAISKRPQAERPDPTAPKKAARAGGR